MVRKGSFIQEAFPMTCQIQKQCVVLLLGLAGLLAAATPVSAQVEKATVKIDGMI